MPLTTVAVNMGGTGAQTAANAQTNLQTLGFKNRIINGAMVIDQRNNGASGTAIGGYTVDRWGYVASTSSKLTWQQNAPSLGSVAPPAGFTNYLGVTSSSSYSVPAGETYVLQQPIEGFNTADLGWGTANAKTVTLSFWVRSSLTGTFGGVITNSAANRSYPFTYTISAANTWEYETITIAGDTTGTWLTTNGVGVLLRFSLGTGSTLSGTAGAWSGSTFYSATGATSVVGTNGATFYITGVQLEVGSVATTFDYRPYGTELLLCQRYASQVGQGSGYALNSTTVRFTIAYPVQMRASPTITGFSGAFRWFGPGLFDITSSSTPAIAANDLRIATIDQPVSGASASIVLATSNGGAMLISAEL
jgi:hypothetical protein